MFHARLVPLSSGSVRQNTTLDDPGGFQEICCGGGTVLLRLARSAIHRLDSLVREGTRNGAEAGGLLIGSVALDRSKVTLLDVIPIECAYTFGPAFRLSEDELQKFAATLADHSRKPPCVIGYFRSHLRLSVTLRREDEDLMQRFFAGAGCAVLLVHPDPGQQSIARFCQWDGLGDVHLLDQFVLDTASAPLEADNTQVAPVPLQQPDLPIDSVSTTETALDLANPRRLRFIHAPIAAASVILLLAGIGLGRLTASRKPVPDPVLFEIAIEAHGPTVQVNWNPASPAVRNSDRGALDFVEGSDLKRIDLNQGELRAGHYEYTPSHSDLTCLMTIYRNPNVFIGATVDFHMDLPQTMATVSPAAAPIAPPTVPTVAPTGKSTVFRSSTEQSSGARLSGLPFTTPPAVAKPAPAPRVEEPPEIATTVSSSASLPLPVSRFPAVAPPPVPVPAPVLSPPPAPLVTPAPPPQSVLLDPIPITRVSPAIPEAVKSEVRRMVLIHVAIQIDAQGRVTGAHALDATDRTATILAPYAIQAAHQWRFSPARRDGTPVAGQTVVAFQFGKD